MSRRRNVHSRVHANWRSWHLQPRAEGPPSEPVAWTAEPQTAITAYRPLLNREALADDFGRIADFLGSSLSPRVFEVSRAPRCVVGHGRPDRDRLEEMFGTADVASVVGRAAIEDGFLTGRSFDDMASVPVRSVALTRPASGGVIVANLLPSLSPGLRDDREYSIDSFGLSRRPPRLGVASSPDIGLSVADRRLSEVQGMLQPIVPRLNMQLELGPLELEIGQE